jgi:branched-chain amino acid transport system ATP-binding protein
MLAVERIDTFYGETQVLRGLSLTAKPGEVVALLGPNGAGKTTTLRSILGLTPARRGAIRFDGRDVTRQPRTRSRGRAWAGCPTIAGSSRR